MTWALVWKAVGNILWKLRGVIAIAALACALLWALSELRDEREARKDAEVRASAAVDALASYKKLHAFGEATDKQVKEAVDDIRKADPADRDRIARDRLCRLQNNCLR